MCVDGRPARPRRPAGCRAAHCKESCHFCHGRAEKGREATRSERVRRKLYDCKIFRPFAGEATHGTRPAYSPFVCQGRSDPKGSCKMRRRQPQASRAGQTLRRCNHLPGASGSSRTLTKSRSAVASSADEPVVGNGATTLVKASSNNTRLTMAGSAAYKQMFDGQERDHGRTEHVELAYSRLSHRLRRLLNPFPAKPIACRASVVGSGRGR